MLCIYDFLRNMRPTKLICVDIKKKSLLHIAREAA